MKKIIAILMAALMCLTMTAMAESYTVGVCQLVQHEALDAATQGFKDALTEELGDKVTFDEQNAQGDSNTCSTIVNSFVSNNVDLILANATPALQAAAAGNKAWRCCPQSRRCAHPARQSPLPSAVER